MCVSALDFQCNVPLGMESGRISNMQISASSTYSDGRWTPQQSRLNSDDNGWTPNVDSNKEYLQVPFQPPHLFPHQMECHAVKLTLDHKAC